MPIITLDLNPQEYNDVWGWVNYYRRNPQYVGIPVGEWHDGAPDYQTRIVLSDSTAARFNQLNAQFPGAGPIPPTDPFADLKWRYSHIGSWAAFSPLFFIESNALKAAYPDLDNTIAQINAYYGPGGHGNINGVRIGSLFFYDNFKTGKREPDVNDAADNFILENSISADHPNGIPPPTINIP